MERSKIPAGLLGLPGAELLNRAIAASGKSHRAFAYHVLGRDESTVRRWLAGKPIPGVVRSYLCRVIMACERANAEATE